MVFTLRALENDLPVHLTIIELDHPRVDPRVTTRESLVEARKFPRESLVVSYLTKEFLTSSDFPSGSLGNFLAFTRDSLVVTLGSTLGVVELDNSKVAIFSAELQN